MATPSHVWIVPCASAFVDHARQGRSTTREQNHVDGIGKRNRKKRTKERNQSGKEREREKRERERKRRDVRRRIHPKKDGRGWWVAIGKERRTDDVRATIRRIGTCSGRRRE